MFSLVLATSALAVAPRIASYDIRADLDPATHRIRATERVTWVNSTSAPTAELWFHLYLNAFAGEDTTFFRESKGRHREFRSAKDGWGWTHLRRVALADGTDLTSRVRFAAPDDGNTADRTVAVVALLRPVAPGETVSLDVAFDALLPPVFARTGWADDFHLLGQWFPKLGVLEMRADGTAGWNCHQFHLNSEFYADFGDYRVALTLPLGWTTGATGTLSERREVEGRQTVVYSQPGVHDFALVAARDLVEETATFTDADVPRAWRLRFARLLGLAPESLRLPEVTIHLLIPARLRPLAARQIAATKAAIAYYGLAYGPYPYPTITVVVPPPDAGGAGGMEYPTFITSAASWRDLLPPRSWRQETELVTIHEYGHQYFYGMLASNEFEHPWMDEGLNTYAEYRTREAFRRDIAPTPILPLPLELPSWFAARAFLATLPPGEPLDTPAWRFGSTFEYFLAAYDHPALVLATCERLAGHAPFARGMRDYAQEFRFRHPGPEDFFTVMGNHVDAAAASFLRTAITTSSPCDFAVERATATRTHAPAGTLAPDVGGPSEPPRRAPQPERSRWRNEVTVARLGDLVAPVVVELRYSDGTLERRTWDANGRSLQLTTETAAALTQATVDPDAVFLVDRNRVNNTLAVEPAASARWKTLLDAAGLVLALSGLLGGVP